MPATLDVRGGGGVASRSACVASSIAPGFAESEIVRPYDQRTI
jgi:hypothetical protein